MFMFKTVLATLALLVTSTTKGLTNPFPPVPSMRLSNEVKLLPDFSSMSLFDLGMLEEAGSLGSEFNSYADYDLSRIWNRGDTLDRVLKLGDVEDKIAPQDFLVGDIFQLSRLQTDFLQLPLSSFPLLERQTLSELVTAIPDLGNAYVHQVAPIETLIQEQFPGYDYRGRQLSQIALQQNFGSLSLDMLSSDQLDGFTLQQIPNIEQAQLGDFADWKSAFFSEIPGLAQVPLADYPDPISNLGTFVARIDWVWSSAESDRSRTISGSYLEGFSVPCQTQCAHLELDDVENSGQVVGLPFEGSQWISGLYQKVAGGSGCLVGLEPTGIHPFGDIFKVVLWDTFETSDTARVVLFFDYKTLCGKSPYVLGPVAIPWGNVRNNDWIFIGN